MLPVEVLLIIAEMNNESFASMRLVSRAVRDYTNMYMEKYKKKFSIDVVIRNSGGKIKKYRQLPNGDRHGIYKEYYENGKLKERSRYKDGKLNGDFILYNRMGIPTIKCSYLNGEKHGFYQSMYNNGQIIEQCTFSNGKYEGLYQHWYKKSTSEDRLVLRCECYYRDNRLNGPYRAWYKNGNLKLRCFFINGYNHLIQEMWYDNGGKMQKCFYCDGRYHGVYKTWDENGKLLLRHEYSYGEVVK